MLICNFWNHNHTWKKWKWTCQNVADVVEGIWIVIFLALWYTFHFERKKEYLVTDPFPSKNRRMEPWYLHFKKTPEVLGCAETSVFGWGVGARESSWLGNPGSHHQHTLAVWLEQMTRPLRTALPSCPIVMPPLPSWMGTKSRILCAWFIMYGGSTDTRIPMSIFLQHLEWI